MMATMVCKLIFREEIVLNKVSNAFVNYINLNILSNDLHILQVLLVDGISILKMSSNSIKNNMFR
jgi:hypothetical protein